MSTMARIEDLSHQTFKPYLADDDMFGDLVDPNSVIDGTRSGGIRKS